MFKLQSVIHRIESPGNVLSTAWHDRFGWVYLDESVNGSGVYPTPDVLDGYLGRFGLFRDPDTRGFRRTVGYPSWENAVTPVNMSVFGAVVDPATLRTTSRAGGSQNPYCRLYRPEKNFADANWNLVVAFADWGYTIGDPSASEGEKFFAGLNALGRLLIVGSEWGGYASMVPGRGGARAALREAGEEAGEKLARQAIRNPVPRRVARAIRLESVKEANAAEKGTLPEWLTHLGRPGSPDAFVTAPADIRRVKTARGLARRLTLLDKNGAFQSGPFFILGFDTPLGIASPINRGHPGFVGFGRTVGGAREWVVPNIPISALRNLTWRVVY